MTDFNTFKSQPYLLEVNMMTIFNISYHTIIKLNNYRNLDENLSFLVTAIADPNFKKCQVFTTTRDLSDIIGSTHFVSVLKLF